MATPQQKVFCVLELGRTNSVVTVQHTVQGLSQKHPTVVPTVARHDMLQRVWEEFSYRFDVVRAAGGGHIERVKYMCLGTTDC
jgi:hypothetical protein